MRWQKRPEAAAEAYLKELAYYAEDLSWPPTAIDEARRDGNLAAYKAIKDALENVEAWLILRVRRVGRAKSVERVAIVQTIEDAEALLTRRGVLTTNERTGLPFVWLTNEIRELHYLTIVPSPTPLNAQSSRGVNSPRRKKNEIPRAT